MAFFAELPREPLPPEQRQVHYDHPFDRPQHWLPGSASFGVVAGRTDDTAVHVAFHDVYPRGVSLEVLVLLHPDGAELDHMHMHHGPSSGRLRLGLQWPDGRRTESDDEWFPGRRGGDDGDFHLQLRGGGGGGLSYSWDAWLWPLPPAGPATLYCRWDDRGIAETATPIELTAVVAAAEAARELWPLPPVPDMPEGEGFGWTAYSPMGGFSTLTAAAPDDGSGDAADPGDENG
jgi:hypothetical protein